MSEERNSILLDVDKSILEKNLLLKEFKDDELDSLLPLLQAHGTDDLPYKLVQPLQGMCVKTHTTAGEKVFVNICHTDAIPCPELVDNDRLLEIWTSEEPGSYRVPMSIGEGHEEPDKGGNPSMVYDIAINTEFFNKVETSGLFGRFLVTVALEGIQDKFKIELNTGGYVVLKNRKVIGKLQKHRIQQRPKDKTSMLNKPLIQEMASTSVFNPPSQKDKDEKLETPKSQEPLPLDTTARPYPAEAISRQPEYRIVREPPDGEVEFLVGEFKMQDVLGVRELTLDIGEDRIILESRRRGYLVDVFVPHSIDQDKTCAQFNRSTGVLTVTMPILAPACN